MLVYAQPLSTTRASRAQLGDLGMSLLSKIVKISTPGPNAVKLDSTPGVVKKAIAVVGPALSAIPGYGTLLAGAAAVITVADQRLKAQRLQSAASSGNASSLMQEYQGLMGTVPGRALGVDALQKVVDAAGQQGLWPNVRKWSGAIVPQVVSTGCKGCTPPTMQAWVGQNINGNPLQLVDAWTNLVNSTWGSKWFVAAGPVQRQILIDLIDALLYQTNPNVPLYYGQAAPDAPPPASSPTTPAPSTALPAPSPAPIPLPPPTTTPPPAIVTGPPSSTVPASTTAAPIPPAVADNTRQLIDALLAQGATQAQAFSGAMQSLAASGVQATPQVQQAVAEEVKAKSALPWPWIIGGGAAGLLVLTLALTRRHQQPMRAAR